MTQKSAISLLQEVCVRAQKARLMGIIPRVAFDCDQTLIDGDIGEATLATVILNGELPRQQAWWAPLLEILDESVLKTLKTRYELESKQGLISPDLFHQIWTAYEMLCQRNIREGYLLAARIWLGLSEQQMTERCHYFVSEALKNDLHPCPKTGSIVSRGVRPRPYMMALIKALTAQEIEVWIVSSSQRQLVQILAPHLGIPPQRVLGIDFHIDEHIGADPIEPCPIAQGKSERFLSVHQNPPLGMFGDSRYDLPLMETSGWGVLIDHGSVAVVQMAQKLGVVQILPASEVSDLYKKT